MSKSFGFIGGGRVVHIILAGLRNQDYQTEEIKIYDPNDDAVKALQQVHPEYNIVSVCIEDVGDQDWIFLAVHPPDMKSVLVELASVLKPNSLVISLAPVITISEMAILLGDHSSIARSIPNAASYINHGYNPVCFAPGVDSQIQVEFLGLMKSLGECPVVEESTLEAYAIITAMGPTYFWPQIQQLHQLALQYGLTDKETAAGIQSMLQGTIDLLYNSPLEYDRVIDLIPVKPMNEQVGKLCENYQTSLTALYQKLKRIN